MFVNTDTGIMSVEQRPVVQVHVRDFQLIVDWKDEEWSSWTDLQTDPQFRELLDSSSKKLADAKQRVSKGKGTSKGKTPDDKGGETSA